MCYFLPPLRGYRNRLSMSGVSLRSTPVCVLTPLRGYGYTSKPRRGARIQTWAERSGIPGRQNKKTHTKSTKSTKFLGCFAATYTPASPEGAQEYRRGWSVAEPPVQTKQKTSPEGAAE